MGAALEAFQNPTPVQLILPNNISNQTGSTSPCGFLPDVEGNNAFFNNLCLQQPQAAIAGFLDSTTSTSFPANTVTTVKWNVHGQTTPAPTGIPADTTTPPFQWLICPYTGYYLATVIGLQITPFTTGSVMCEPVDNHGVVLANLSPFNLTGVSGNIEFYAVQNYNAGQYVGVAVSSATAGLVYNDSGAIFTLVFLGR